MMGDQPANAVFALVVGAFAAFVAYGRVRLAPLRTAGLGRDRVPAI
jgi:hypothetical protein